MALPSTLIASACAAFRGLAGPKESTAFEELIQLPPASSADVTALLATIADGVERLSTDIDCSTAGPPVVGQVCSWARGGLVGDALAAAEWCRAVRWLCCGYTDTDVDNHAAFLAEGGLLILLQLMDVYVVEEPVCAWGCSALIMLSRDQEIMAALLSGGGLHRLYVAMESHLISARVQENACHALTSLAEYDDNLSLIYSTGGLHYVYAAMDAHLASAGVQEAACSALCKLADEDVNRVMIVCTGGLDRLYDAMVTHPTAEGMLLEAISTMFYLSCDPVNIRPMRAGGANEIVAAVIAAHAANEDLTAYGFAVMSHMS